MRVAHELCPVRFVEVKNTLKRVRVRGTDVVPDVPHGRPTVTIVCADRVSCDRGPAVAEAVQGGDPPTGCMRRERESISEGEAIRTATELLRRLPLRRWNEFG